MEPVLTCKICGLATPKSPRSLLSNLIAMASNLVAMASKLVAMASNLIVACPCFSVSGKCKRKRKLNSGRRGIVGSEDAAAFDILHLERVVPSRLAPILTRMY